MQSLFYIYSKNNEMKTKLIDNLDKYRVNVWKEVYYEFHPLIKEERIFSKLPNRIMIRAYYTREYASFFGHVVNFFKNLFVIPALLFWKIFLIKFEYLYYKRKYPEGSMLENIKDVNFDFLFVLNTRDHVITALPVLEKMNEMGKKILIVTFKGVYSKYKVDFDRLKNAKLLFFVYELKNLSIRENIEILTESTEKFKMLESYEINADIKRVIQMDKNFIKLHLKEELIQYHFFKEIFDSFDLKGVVSIVLTTAFGIAKERDIPTFILQHGIGGGGHHPYISDYIIAYDEPTKDELNRWTNGTVVVLPLGAPRFEYLAGVSKKVKRKNFNRQLGKSINTRNVTYISVGTKGFENKELFLALKELRQKLPDDVNLIIKLHPREDFKEINVKKEIKKICSKEELKGTIFIKKEMDFYEILANSDVVITTLSTGMFESIAMDIPILQVNFTGKPYEPQLVLSSFGWKEPINDPDVIAKEVLAILNDKKEAIEKQRWLKNRMFTNFGNCGKVIAETIVNICNEKRKIRDE